MQWFLLISFLTVSAPVLTLGQTPRIQGNPQDEAAIRKLMDDVGETWNRHDVVAYSRLFAEDADFTNWRGTLRLHGRQAIADGHAPFFTGFFRKSKLRVVDSRVTFYAPAVAAVHCEWEMSDVIDYDGKGTMPPRKYVPLFIVTKAEGVWQIAVMHNVLVQPLPPGVEEKIRGPVKP